MRSVLLLLAWSLLAGCTSLRPQALAPAPPPAQNFFTPEVRGLPMRRVAMLPLSSGQVSGDALRDVATAFQAELNKKALFEVAPVSAPELEALCGQRQFSSTELLPVDLLAKLRERFGAEGVLLTDITHFNSYRPVAIGVRTKLVDITSGQIRWAFDFVYDAGSPVVAETAKKYQRQYADQRRAIPDDGGSILLSPARFAKYVASETFASLQKGQ